jgi:hypothetical protein
VRDALFEPVREVQSATYFKKVPDPEQKQPFFWEPCAPQTEGAERMNLMDINADLINTPLVSYAHFEACMRNAKPSVTWAGSQGRMKMQRCTLKIFINFHQRTDHSFFNFELYL